MPVFSKSRSVKGALHSVRLHQPSATAVHHQPVQLDRNWATFNRFQYTQAGYLSDLETTDASSSSAATQSDRRSGFSLTPVSLTTESEQYSEAERPLVAIDEKTTLTPMSHQRPPVSHQRPRWADLQDATPEDWGSQGQAPTSQQNDPARSLMRRQVGRDTRSHVWRNQWHPHPSHTSQWSANQPRYHGTSGGYATSKESPF